MGFDTLGAVIGILGVIAIGYGLAVAVALFVRSARGDRDVFTHGAWHWELTFTTVILAAPGLLLAVVGIIVLVGVLALAMGVWMLVVTVGVDRGKQRRAHMMPLIFVGIVDLLALSIMVQSVVGYASWDDGFYLVAIPLYFALATGNAVRIMLRGRANNRSFGLAGSAHAPGVPGSVPAPPLAGDDGIVVPPPPSLPPLPDDADADPVQAVTEPPRAE